MTRDLKGKPYLDLGYEWILCGYDYSIFKKTLLNMLKGVKYVEGKSHT